MKEADKSKEENIIAHHVPRGNARIVRLLIRQLNSQISVTSVISISKDNCLPLLLHESGHI